MNERAFPVRRKTFTQKRRPNLENAANYSPVSSNRSAVDHQPLRTGHEGHDRRHLIGRLETLEQRARPSLLEKHLLHIGFREALLLGQAVEKRAYSLGLRGPRQD